MPGFDYVISWARTCSEKALYRVGRRVAGTDYAVAHYLYPWHPKFFGNRERLEHVVRGAIGRRGLDPALVAMMREDEDEYWEDRPEHAATAAEMVVSGIEDIRRAILALDDSAQDRLLTEIAPDDAEAGDDFLKELGYKEVDGAVEYTTGVRHELETAHATLILAIADGINILAPNPAIPRGLAELAAAWPIGDAARGLSR